MLVLAMFALAAPARALRAAPRRIHLVVNPYGGGGAAAAAVDAVLPIFAAAGVEVTTLVTEYAGHAGEYARTVPLLDGFVGVGGDGTAHEIANGMLRRADGDRCPVGVVPAGSGNTWAYDLGLDDAAAAAAVVAKGATTRVDAIAVRGTGPSGARGVDEYAINMCGYGMPAAVLEEANALRWLGSAQYELAGLALIANGRTAFSASVEIEREDGAVETRDLDDFSFAQAQINAHMGKRVPFAPGASMDDGLIDLILVKKSGGLDILEANARARGATHLDLPFVERIRCRSYALSPTGGGSAALNLDGELAGAAPFRATCVPGALEVYAEALREAPNDTSGDFEPRVVLALARAWEALGGG